jgi:Saxitoxin biosynthesis operon protein SxtJ
MTGKPESTGLRELRNFGLVFSAFLVGLFGFLLPLLLDKSNPIWPWPLAATLTGLALVSPKTLATPYRWWMKFGQVAGAINSRIILSIMFFGLITPIALIIRALRKDLLSTRLDSKLNTYRVRKETQEKSHMEKPY